MKDRPESHYSKMQKSIQNLISARISKDYPWEAVSAGFSWLSEIPSYLYPDPNEMRSRRPLVV